MDKSEYGGKTELFREETCHNAILLSTSFTQAELYET